MLNFVMKSFHGPVMRMDPTIRFSSLRKLINLGTVTLQSLTPERANFKLILNSRRHEFSMVYSVYL